MHTKGHAMFDRKGDWMTTYLCPETIQMRADEVIQ